MELAFTKEGNKWIANIEATSDFNLHIEKGAGALSVLQTSVAGGKYDNVRSLYMSMDDATMDKDVTALIYPKYLRIESYTQDAPIGVVTFKE